MQAFNIKPKHVIKHKLIANLVILLGLILAIIIYIGNLDYTRAAGNASIVLSPSSASYETGKTFVTNVQIVTGSEPTQSVQVVLNYDSSKLQLTNIATASQPYETTLVSNTNAGTIDVVRASLDGNVTGTNTFMKLTFKTLATGTATIQVKSGSYISDESEPYDNDGIWNGVQNSSTITIKNPTSTPAPSENTNPPTENNNPTPSPNVDPKPPSDQSPTPTENIPPINENPPAGDLVIEQPKVAERKLKKAVFQLKTKVPVKAKILFGLDGQLIHSTEETELSTNPSIQINEKFLEPGRTYSYKVILTDKDGNTTETPTETFRAKGYRLRLVLKDKEGEPLKNLKVVLRSEPREGTTDENGVVLFEDVELGKHTAYFSIQGKEFAQAVQVNDLVSTNEDGEEVIPIQTTEVIVENKGINLILVVTSVLLLIIIIVLILYILKKRNKSTPLNSDDINTTKSPENSSNLNNTISIDSSSYNDNTEKFLKPQPPEAGRVITPEQNQ